MGDRRRAVAEDRRRVLVVDDLPEICDLFRDALAMLDARRIEVVAVTSGAEALDRIARERFDLVVSDYRMPDVTGLDVLAGVRARLPEARRVLMTGYNEIPVPAAQLAEVDVDAYLQKPFDVEDGLVFLFDLLYGSESQVAAIRERAREAERVAFAEEAAALSNGGGRDD